MSFTAQQQNQGCMAPNIEDTIIMCKKEPEIQKVNNIVCNNSHVIEMNIGCRIFHNIIYWSVFVFGIQYCMGVCHLEFTIQLFVRLLV